MPPPVQTPPHRVSGGRSIRAARILLIVQELGLPSWRYMISRNGELFPECCRLEFEKRREHGLALHTKRTDDTACHRIVPMPPQPFRPHLYSAESMLQPQYQDISRSGGRAILLGASVRSQKSLGPLALRLPKYPGGQILPFEGRPAAKNQLDGR